MLSWPGRPRLISRTRPLAVPLCRQVFVRPVRSAASTTGAWGTNTLAARKAGKLAAASKWVGIMAQASPVPRVAILSLPPTLITTVVRGGTGSAPVERPQRGMERAEIGKGTEIGKQLG